MFRCFLGPAGPIEAKTLRSRFNAQAPVARSGGSDAQGDVASVDRFDRKLLERRRIRPRMFAATALAGDSIGIDFDGVIETVDGPGKMDAADILRVLKCERCGGR